MAKVIRLIWRLDYPFSYAFLDRLGSVRKIMSETVPRFWSNISNGSILYSYAADYQSNESGISRDMSVEVQSLNGQLRWRNGTDLARILQTEEFRNIDRIVRELLRTLEVREMRRVGLRFLGMGNFADGKGGGYKRFVDLISKDFVRLIELPLDGHNEDLGITFTGRGLCLCFR